MTLGDVLYLFVNKTRNVPSFLYPAGLNVQLIMLQTRRHESLAWLLSKHLPM